MPTFREDVKLGTKVPLIRKCEISDFVVNEGDVVDGSITNKKIADKTITKEKLTDDVLIAENIKVGDSNLTSVLDKKVDKSSVVQETGYSKTDIMSQKAVTDELDNINDATNKIISILAENGFNINLLSSNGMTFKYSYITQTNADGSYADFTTLSIDAKWFVNDVTDEIYNIKWTRDTGDEEADAAWNKAHENCGPSISISYRDLGGSCYEIGHVSFTCEAEYNAEGEVKTAVQSVNF